MEKYLQTVAINVLIGVSVFMNILSIVRCEDGSSTPLSDELLSPVNQPLNAQPYTPLVNGQPLANQLPVNSPIGQQFPLVNQPLINQPAFVNQPFSPLNVQPGLNQQPLLNGQNSLGQALNQPFVNSFAFSGSDSQCLSYQVVSMATCLMVLVLSFLFYS